MFKYMFACAHKHTCLQWRRLTFIRTPGKYVKYNTGLGNT